MPDTEGRVDGLFALPPEDFVEARNQLARELRAAGDRATATAVKDLRRPTVAAWALNQLTRRHPDDLAELFAAGEAVRQAQRKVLSGLGSAAMREAQRRRRTAVERLVAHAAGTLRDQGSNPDAHTVAIRRALDAASVDEETAQAVRGGRLSQPPEPELGFGDVGGLTLVPEEPEDPEEQPPAEAEAEEDEAAARRQEVERARARLADARRAADEAAAEATARREEAGEAARVAAEADAEVERLSAELEAARQRATERADQAERAAADAGAAEDAARDRERDQRAAAADLDQLEGA